MAKTLEELAVEIEWVKQQHISCQASLNTTVGKIFDEIKGFTAKMTDDREDLVEQITTNRRETDEKYQNRLPLWATLLIPILTMTIGWLVK